MFINISGIETNEERERQDQLVHVLFPQILEVSKQKYNWFSTQREKHHDLFRICSFAVKQQPLTQVLTICVFTF